MKKYQLTSPKFTGVICFEFAENGYLSGLTIDAELSNVQHAHLLQNTPLKIQQLGLLKERFKTATITEVPEDLSFNRFWQEYDYKKGKKVQTQNTWERLSKADKVKALTFIKTLKNQKRLDGTAMPYPNTYLNQRYFEG